MDTLSQRAEVAKTFALSKLYYVAQVLSLNEKYRKQIETSLSNFIFKGRHEKLKLSELENADQGGLGLPNIGVKSDCLLLRMLALLQENCFRLPGYWLRSFRRETGWGENFPAFAEIRPVSHNLSKAFTLHKYM